MDRQMRALKETVEERYGCACRHAGFGRVCEQAEGGLMWEGDVQTFELIGHAHAKLCFAFTVGHGVGKIQQVTALSPPIKSPEWAVKVFLMRERMKAAVSESLSK